MIIELNDYALAAVERQPEMSQLARGDTRTKHPPHLWEWSIAQGGNLVLNPSSDWQPVQRSEQRLCMVSPSSAKDKTTLCKWCSLFAGRPASKELQ